MELLSPSATGVGGGVGGDVAVFDFELRTMKG